MAQVWDFLVRFRNYVITAIGGLLLFLPDLLSAPELLAVLPAQYHKWVFFGALLLNLAARWRPATRTADPEVQFKKSLRVDDDTEHA